MGECVILDASWTRETDRMAVRTVANDMVSDLIELRCIARAEVAAARIGHRREAGTDASDADAAIAAAMAATFDRWPGSHEVSTEASITEVVSAALGHLG
jgi:predicted kinase